MRIEKVNETQDPSFTPVTVKFTAETRYELELLTGFLFLDALDPDNKMTDQAKDVLLDIADDLSVNDSVVALFRACEGDYSLKLAEAE